jgi:hypothetical protein
LKVARAIKAAAKSAEEVRERFRKRKSEKILSLAEAQGDAERLFRQDLQDYQDYCVSKHKDQISC